MAAGSTADAAKVRGGARGGRPLAATLTGAAETPGPGDPEGARTAVVTFNQGEGEVCFEITVANTAAPTAAHIVGVTGSPHVPLPDRERLHVRQRGGESRV